MPSRARDVGPACGCRVSKKPWSVPSSPVSPCTMGKAMSIPSKRPAVRRTAAGGTARRTHARESTPSRRPRGKARIVDGDRNRGETRARQPSEDRARRDDRHFTLRRDSPEDDTDARHHAGPARVTTRRPPASPGDDTNVPHGTRAPESRDRRAARSRIQGNDRDRGLPFSAPGQRELADVDARVPEDRSHEAHHARHVVVLDVERDVARTKLDQAAVDDLRIAASEDRSVDRAARPVAVTRSRQA